MRLSSLMVREWRLFEELSQGVFIPSRTRDHPAPFGPYGPILKVATWSLVATWSRKGGRRDKVWVRTTRAITFWSRWYGHRIVVATSDGVAMALLTDVTGVLSVRTALSGVRRTHVNATWAPVAIAFPIFESSRGWSGTPRTVRSSTRHRPAIPSSHCLAPYGPGTVWRGETSQQRQGARRAEEMGR
ncbi:hypothetical protein Taro_033826 [Colocasia esculenta]|uniref:Uncharacterized protein n=1 Tax=Colocasia esculenta TaxID=4460 RepID=A0A843W2I1_COLES|nr:hypothetical protein [Colocasia esculenta]